jgi:Tfp pilus assembly protein PilF
MLHPPTYLLMWMAAFICLAGGCAALTSHPKKGYRTLDVDVSHDTETARRETARALKILERNADACFGDDLVRAENALQKALAADVMYGPAHNNLGRIYFQKQEFYLAAWEFEYAIKTMPDRTEPISNLGMVYEEVGKFDKAIEMYWIAYEIDPHNPEVIGNLARCSLRQGESVEQVRPLLEDLIFMDSRPEWVDWAKEQLVFSQVKASRDVDGSPLEPESGGPSESSQYGPELLPQPAPAAPDQVELQQFEQSMGFDDYIRASAVQ